VCYFNYIYKKEKTMSLADQINGDIKQAMLAKDKDKLAALRAVKSEILLEATKGGGTDVSDEIALKIIQKLVKQRKDSSAIFIEQGREDLAKDELFQIEVLAVYLPAQMGEDEVRKVVQEVIAQVGAAGPQDMGKVMGPIMGKLNGKADGKLISTLVKEELNK
tara:strand:- start:84 stop:572 length:489 start_codon:yes stop_codon:yes gene_type:complete